jgi:tumor protein p53-inducible protein 3
LKFGANYTINYKTNENWSKEVLEYTDGRGANVVADPVLASHFNQNMKSLAMDARWIMFASLGGVKIKEANLADLLIKRASIIASTLKSRNDKYKTELIDMFMNEVLPYFNKAPEGKQKLVPVVDRVFNMSEAAIAHEYLESNQTIGKIVLLNDLQ